MKKHPDNWASHYRIERQRITNLWAGWNQPERSVKWEEFDDGIWMTSGQFSELTCLVAFPDKAAGESGHYAVTITAPGEMGSTEEVAEFVGNPATPLSRLMTEAFHWVAMAVADEMYWESVNLREEGEMAQALDRYEV